MSASTSTNELVVYQSNGDTSARSSLFCRATIRRAATICEPLHPPMRFNA